MEFEGWWLLAIPVLFAMGWVAARFEGSSRSKEQGRLPGSYFKGVNFLLSDQPDKAIDAFLEVAAVDTSTVELHFALGNLFRKKGEIDRAIRVHQFLADREQISQTDRERAAYELGADFLRAGILDRAEAAFSELQHSSVKAEAASQLLVLYELEKEWDKAIGQAQVLRGLGAKVPESSLAHFHCEIAQSLIDQFQLSDALEMLGLALKVNPSSVRASLMLGGIAYRKGEFELALSNWRNAEQQNPWYLPVVGARMWDAFVQLDQREQGIFELRQYVAKYPSLDLLDVLVCAVQETQGFSAAYELLRTEVRARPSLLGLDRLLERQLSGLEQSDHAQDLKLARDLISKHKQRLERYRCQNCGFQAQKFYWQCPGCASWDTIVPRRAEELDFYQVSA